MDVVTVLKLLGEVSFNVVACCVLVNVDDFVDWFKVVRVNIASSRTTVDQDFLVFFFENGAEATCIPSSKLHTDSAWFEDCHTSRFLACSLNR